MGLKEYKSNVSGDELEKTTQFIHQFASNLEEEGWFRAKVPTLNKVRTTMLFADIWHYFEYGEKLTPAEWHKSGPNFMSPDVDRGIEALGMRPRKDDRRLGLLDAPGDDMLSDEEKEFVDRACEQMPSVPEDFKRVARRLDMSYGEDMTKKLSFDELDNDRDYFMGWLEVHNR